MVATAHSSGRPPFAGLRVIELAADPGGDYAGHLLAEMGAEIIKVEPPEGSPMRAIGPFVNAQSGAETSLHFSFYNSNKKSVVLDPRQPDDLARLNALIGGADIFISTLQPTALRAAGLDFDALCATHPALIILSITPFGLDGPWADYQSSDLVALALGGPLNSCGYDDHSIPPIRPGGNQGYHTAASFAHIGVLLALLERQRGGKGQILDVSMHESLAVNVELANPYWFYPRVNIYRQTCRHAQPIPTQSALFRCADDRYVYYTLILSDQRAWAELVRWMDTAGMSAGLTDAAYLDVEFRQTHFHEIQTIVECFFLTQPAQQAYRDGQARQLPIGVLNAPEDLLKDEHLAARKFFVPVIHADGTTVLYPGPPYVFSSFGSVARAPAPKLGEHTSDVLES
jgi:crotonobetainyl-CoA:carnitine CoA-transferase CaiB-like acyl-CoA transferase